MRIWRWRKNSGFVVSAVIWCLTSVIANADSTIYNTLGGSAGAERPSPAERHETTVPLLLTGRDSGPLSQLEPGVYPASLRLLVRAEGQQLVLLLEKNEGLFASHYTETHYRNGERVVTGARNSTMKNCYYHGEVQAHRNSDVTLSVCSGLRGFIALENKSLVIEPASGKSPDVHFIYRAEQLRLTSGDCGHGDNISSVTPDNDLQSPFRAFRERHKRDAQKTTKYVELIIVADNREFHKQGGDVEKVKLRLAEIANYVDKFYRALNIRVALVGLEVWSDHDKCPVTQDPFATLHEFLDWRKVKLLSQKPHDNAQLISGVYFQGTTIGMAPIMSMCTVEQSGGIVMDHSENPLGAAVTLAHELGHNFGMNHDTPERGCGCRMTVDRGGCIMTPSTGYPFPTVFSTCSKKDLAASLEKGVGMCLDNMPEVKVLYGGQKCGNGYVEEGEECDCGEPEECLNPCCNATTCTLKGDAVCAHGQCCDNCQLKPPGTMCRDSGNSCDLPEFCTGAASHCPANVYLHDGHACHAVEGYCYNGICQTHEQQCITLWGPGAKPAPGICFERVNSAGDPYGNCGKDSKGSFAKCDARDAKCGKIQCQGGANRPVIGTNAVSIETNIPLQEGGRILCRGTHVYLGDDMPDPGLVLAGTKCGDGRVCLNRQCQNVSIFGVHECSGKCNGRGVCNNKKNCHCQAHWAPPFCEGAGFGGSIDSGPTRLAADSVLVIVSVLVAASGLLLASGLVFLKRKTLLRLLFTHRKSTLEKLRSIEAKRPTSPARTQFTCRPGPQRKAPPKPCGLGAGIYKPSLLSAEPLLPPHKFHSHSLRRLPLYQPLHISQPMPVSLSVGQPTLPPLPARHRLPTADRRADAFPPPAVPPFLSLPRRPASYRLGQQDFDKPSPPQKPLPADPLSRSARLGHGTSALGLHNSGRGPLPIPIPTVPKPPPTIPLPSRPAPVLPYRPPKSPKKC
ncbi:disintegrin and metalloproteinase domain-containing protein 12 isoform X1 [Syngnathus acus]|uniref:disintegrin and metalloproteinase domain-containing protein 12 isoform X1 n=2 Tax=Syngnathus acus TaxID=161584 RepID=UPI001885D4A0|nr:disintegrin and metalloproteinase domain-containing protein 12 isoform X1 [Syngnathus acus]XP_037127250.1 disintegrin and metalloproteinase domain-containing protein 12 isoform X1 [Syngnathus acus]